MLSTWLKRNLHYYAARHFILGVTIALSAAIICAALMTGHSLHQGLQQALSKRIGSFKQAVYFPGSPISCSASIMQPDIQAALMLRGELLDHEGRVCANSAQIIGLVQKAGAPAASHALLNARARALLQGSQASIRFKKPTTLSIEMPIADTKQSRLIRRAIQLADDPDAHPGVPADFSLEPSTLPPVNVFVPYELLAEALEEPGKANLFLSPQEHLTLPLTTDDYGIELIPTADGTLVKSRHIYLPAPLTQTPIAPTQAACFYLADAFEANGLDTPYGFVGAVTPGWCGTPSAMRDDEVVISTWLAKKLNITTNQPVVLRWRRFEANGELIPEQKTFTVCAVITTEEAATFKSIMPIFPGMKDVDSCAAWDVGMPMDEKKLNDPDNEAYWKQWRETPKLIMTATTGKRCFGDRFGQAMSLKVKASTNTVKERIEASLKSTDAGALTLALATEGKRAAAGATDFNGLFVGMMFLLIIASVLLSSLTFSLTLETRKHDIALFLATGWSASRCMTVLISEWIPTLLISALLGTALGQALAQGLIWTLSTFWRTAFANAPLAFHFSWPVALSSMLVTLLVMLLMLVTKLRQCVKQKPASLWQTADELLRAGSPGSLRSMRMLSALGSVFALAALGIILVSVRGAHANAAFFTAGFLLLLSLVLFVHSLSMLWQHGHLLKTGPLKAGIARAIFLTQRSTPVVILIALGTFLVIGVLSMKHDPAADVSNPSSGSGGFASIVSSVVPYDRERGMEMAKRVTGSHHVIPLRVHEGDTAGCLNMNAPVAPTVYGVDVTALSRMRAFEPPAAGGVWSPLLLTLTNNAYPALAADLSMLNYSLKAKAHPTKGTRIVYPTATLQLVGVLPIRSTILQGGLLMNEASFLNAFPSDHGYRLWLCDYAPYSLREATDRRNAHYDRQGAKLNTLRHPEPGITVETTEERLWLLSSVESTYLDMFLVFGGLGMVLALFGIALVIVRGVEERKHEFAVLRAIGLSPRHILMLLFAEYGVLVLTGILLGLIPAIIAIQPAAYALRNQMPWSLMSTVIIALLTSSLLSIMISAHYVSRHFSIHALKNK